MHGARLHRRRGLGLKRRRFGLGLVGGGVVLNGVLPGSGLAAAGAAPTSPARGPTQAFALNQVRLNAGPLFDAQQRNLQYLLALDPARLLAPFRREAGLPALAPTYGSWESTGLDGHMGGHVLSALALMWAATGQPLLLVRLQALLQGLQACQDAQPAGPMAGYLGGIPEGRALWLALARGEVQADNFSLNGRWVPWYNLHKTLAGLRDAWLHAQQPVAKTMLLRLVDWVARTTAGLDEAQFQAMLRTEHGGMAEVLADAHAIGGEAAHLALARRFVHQAIVAPLAAGQDTLTGLHANTQIPKLSGVQRIAELAPTAADGPTHTAPAAAFFWQQVVQQRSVAMGGNSVKEHFHDSADFSAMLQDVEGPESCNSYNLLKLSAQLFHRAPHRRYTDFAERVLFNHVLSAQHPRSGGLVYFTPQRPHHHRVYSTVHEGMWCCVGSGVEVHGRHGELVYAHDADALWVNLFVASSLNAPALGLHLQQRTAFPCEAGTRLTWRAPSTRALRLRVPAWVKPGAWVLRVNGRPPRARPVLGEDGYLHLPGPWRAGDQVQLQLPMHTRLEALPDGSAPVAVLHGPVVLAVRSPAGVLKGEGGAVGAEAGLAERHFGDDSRMGHIASGPVAPATRTLLLRDPAGFLARLRPVPGRALSFRTADLAPAEQAAQGAPTAASAPLLLQPFFRLHEARYQLYFPRVDTAALQRQQAQQAAQATERAALQARTVDQVAPGEQQPEADHGYQAEGGDTGLHLGRRWRHATGWFSYELRDPQRQGSTLRLTLATGDAGRRFTVWANGHALPPLALREQPDPGADGPFYDLDLPLPAAALAAAPGRLQLRFVAEPGSVAGGLYGLRWLKP